MGPPFPHLVTWGGHYLSSFRRFVSEVKIVTPLSPASQGQPGVRSEHSVPLVWVAGCGWYSMENVLQTGCSETWRA